MSHMPPKYLLLQAAEAAAAWQVLTSAAVVAPAVYCLRHSRLMLARPIALWWEQEEPVAIPGTETTAPIRRSNQTWLSAAAAVADRTLIRICPAGPVEAPVLKMQPTQVEAAQVDRETTAAIQGRGITAQAVAEPVRPAQTAHPEPRETAAQGRRIPSPAPP